MMMNRRVAAAFICSLWACALASQSAKADRSPAILPEETFELVKVNGHVKGFGDLPRDDVMDGALVIPTLRAEDLLSFSIENLMAPDEDLSAGPLKVKVPGNVYMPAQKERYYVPITLKKENFVLHMKRGDEQELYAVWFATPFSQTVDMARAEAPYTDIVPLVSLKGFAFGSNRDWTNEANPTLNLSGKFKKTIGYRWIRAAGEAKTFDVAVAFQRTPANRWIVTDFAAKAAPQGMLKTADGMQGDTKILFVRAFNDANNEPVEAVGHFRSGDVAAQVSAEEVPARIANASVDAMGGVRWDPIAGPGWMAIIRSTKSKVADPERVPVLDFGLRAITGDKDTVTLEDWVNPSTGAYTLNTPLAEGENLAVLFIGTDREVERPNLSPYANNTEPALFTHASELRTIRLK